MNSKIHLNKSAQEGNNNLSIDEKLKITDNTLEKIKIEIEIKGEHLSALLIAAQIQSIELGNYTIIVNNPTPSPSTTSTATTTGS